MKYKKKKPKITLLVAVFCLLCTMWSGCAPKNAVYDKTGLYFDTIIQISVYDPDDTDALEGCMKLAAHYEQLFSRTIPDSDISRINNANGAFVDVDKETIDLLQTGLAYCERSNGAFDLTIGGVSDLWDFKENEEKTLPDPTALKEAVSHVDYRNVKIRGNQAALTDPDAKLDLGGIAKGYIADQMKTYLLSQGVKTAKINLGGNVLILGDQKPDHSDFKIGIQKPFDENGTPIAAITLKDQSMVSSGIYQRYFEKDDRIYHHILDPDTGYPIENNLYAVTIISPRSADGDALSTTCMALGLEDGIKLIESIPDTEAVFITNDLKLHSTSGIGTSISLQEMHP